MSQSIPKADNDQMDIVAILKLYQFYIWLVPQHCTQSVQTVSYPEMDVTQWDRENNFCPSWLFRIVSIGTCTSSLFNPIRSSSMYTNCEYLLSMRDPKKCNAAIASRGSTLYSFGSVLLPPLRTITEKNVAHNRDSIRYIFCFAIICAE